MITSERKQQLQSTLRVILGLAWHVAVRERDNVAPVMDDRDLFAVVFATLTDCFDRFDPDRPGKAWLVEGRFMAYFTRSLRRKLRALADGPEQRLLQAIFGSA
jgi:hypothetical protein